jgi:hypothetical protein
MKDFLHAAMVLIDPAGAWPRVAKEPADWVSLMTRTVVLLALVPALCGFIGVSIIGVIVPGTGVVRVALFDGIFGAIFFYLENFAVVLALGLLLHLTAPLFGGRRDFGAALTLAVFAYTPVWLTGIFLLLPGLRFLMLTGIYGGYILLAGLPAMLQTPPPRARGFATLIVGCALLLTLLAGWAQHRVFTITAP